METEKGQITRIYNGEIITPERNFGVGTVLIAEGKIIGIEPGNYEVPGSIGHDIPGFSLYNLALPGKLIELFPIDL